MATTNGNGRRKRTALNQLIENSKQAEENQSELRQNQVADSFESAQSLQQDTEAIAHPEEQPPGDSPDAQASQDEASGLESNNGAIAHPVEQPTPVATESPATEDSQQEAQAASPSAEEVLRAAKAASQKAQEQATESPSSEPSSSEAPQSSGAIEKTVSSELQQATSDAAKELVDANSQALQERVQIGVREGLEDAKDIRKGYQLGLLKGLTQAKQTDTRELGEQLQALRQHTDQKAQSEVEESLTQLNKTVKAEDLEESPLELVNRLVKESAPKQSENFRIL